MVVFKENRSVQEIRDWFSEFQQIMYKAVVNQYLQFTAKICTNDMNLPPSVNKYKAQIVTNNEFRLLDMKMSWPPEGGGCNLYYSGKRDSN